jgi:maleate isomerase
MYGWRARIGYISPCPGEGEILDFYQIAPSGVSLVVATLSVQRIDEKSLSSALSDPLDRAIRDSADEEVDFIVLAGEPMVFLNGYGSEQVLNNRAKQITSIPFTHNLPCVVEALRHLHVRKIALATPYIVKDAEGRDVTYEKWRAYIKGAEFELVGFKTLGQPSNRDISHLPLYASYRLAKEVYEEAGERPEAIYIPCGRWPAVRNISKLEYDLGIPVVTSIQAWTWKALKEVNIREVQAGYGRLFDGWSQKQ